MASITIQRCRRGRGPIWIFLFDKKNSLKQYDMSVRLSCLLRISLENDSPKGLKYDRVQIFLLKEKLLSLANNGRRIVEDGYQQHYSSYNFNFLFLSKVITISGLSGLSVART